MATLNMRHAGVREALAAGTAVYVGRPTIWGNPYRAGGKDGGGREWAIERFDDLMVERLAGADGAKWLEALHALDGKDLVCWCAPLHCHADVIAAWIEAERIPF